MARNKRNKMADGDTLTDGKLDSPEAKPDEMVLVDYCGTISNDDRGTVMHTRTPLIASIPEDGQMEWISQPGLNLMPRSVVDAYAEHPGIKSRRDAGEIVVDCQIPTAQAAVIELVERSYSLSGLEHILEHEKANHNRRAVLDALVRQMAKPRVEIEPKLYRSHVAKIFKMSKGATMGA